MTAAAEALESGDSTLASGETQLGSTLRRLARGALLGARGNSGVFLSQLFKGLADALAASPSADGRALARALDRASREAYRAVSAPVEGTVGAAAASAALRAVSADGGSASAPAVVALAAALSAREALARTPEQLPVLARAGVVDAGGRGLVVLLDALAEVLTGEPLPAAPVVPSRAAFLRSLTVPREAGSEEFGYEVQFLLDAAEPAIEPLKARLADLGDSLVVVGAEPTWHVHVHVNDVGAAVEAGIDAGRPSRITVTRFADQLVTAPPGPPAAVVSADAEDDENDEAVDHDWAEGAAVRAGRAVVAVCSGESLAALFAAEGAAVVTGRPSTAEVLAAIESTGAGRVVVLPNDRDVAAVAAAAAAEARARGIRAGVVPTRSPVQGLAALAVRDPERRFEDDVIAMAESAGACRYAEVTVAAREALTVAGRCQPGDVLALIEGEVNLIGHDLVHTAKQLLDRLLAGGGELVTLVTGEGAPPDLGEALRAHVAQRWPFAELSCYEGGQPHYPLLVGVE